MALSERDMGYLSAAAFLQCSPSSARQYLHQLEDAGVVTIRPIGSYRLNADPAVAQDFLATLADIPPLRMSNTPACRDPLVVALFGEAALRQVSAETA